MTHLTPHSRRSRTKFPPEYARSGRIDDLLDGFGPRGGGGGRGVGLATAAGDLARKVMRGVIVCGQVKQRLCAIAN